MENMDPGSSLPTISALLSRLDSLADFAMKLTIEARSFADSLDGERVEVGHVITQGPSVLGAKINIATDTGGLVATAFDKVESLSDKLNDVSSEFIRIRRRIGCGGSHV